MKKGLMLYENTNISPYNFTRQNKYTKQIVVKLCNQVFICIITHILITRHDQLQHFKRLHL